VIYSNCDPALTLIGPFFILFGSFFAYVGVLAWIRPSSKLVQDSFLSGYPREKEAGPILQDLGFTREQLGPINLFMFKLLGPPIGALFAIVGLWVTVSQIHCGAHFPDLRPLWGPLAWRPVWFFFVVFVGLIGVWNGRQMQPILRELYVLLTLLFGVAASEAAEFHVGIQANRWGVVGIMAVASAGFIWFLNIRVAGKQAASADPPDRK
jgi:hypothetical protein